MLVIEDIFLLLTKSDAKVCQLNNMTRHSIQVIKKRRIIVPVIFSQTSPQSRLYNTDTYSYLLWIAYLIPKSKKFIVINCTSILVKCGHLYFWALNPVLLGLYFLSFLLNQGGWVGRDTIYYAVTNVVISENENFNTKNTRNHHLIYQNYCLLLLLLLLFYVFNRNTNKQVNKQNDQ